MVKKWFEVDSELEGDLKAERELMRQLKSALLRRFDIKTWIFGHYHHRTNTEIDGIVFEGLDCAQSKKIYGVTLEIK